MPAAFKSLDQGPKGAVISRPTPVPKWSFQERGDPRKDGTAPPNDVTGVQGPVPPRPARPSNVPSILDASKVQECASSMPYEPNEFQDTTSEVVASAPGRPLTASSNGTVPDFLLADSQVTQQTAGRKPHHLGPPRSSRRGASSLYSTNSFVPPIPEESPENSPHAVRSFASSKVIPSSWGSAPRTSEVIGFYENMPDSPSSNRSQSPQDPEVSLVRQASLGRRGKPSLCTIKGENRSENGSSISRPSTPGDSTAHSARIPVSASTLPTTELLKSSDLRNQVNAPRQLTHQPSYSSSSESSLDDLEKPRIPLSAHPALKDLEAGGLKGPKQRKLDARRPPRLNIDAVREAEARGSLTSLPDLIRRATRLAHNLDRGKTASRLGMLDMLGASPDPKKPRRNSGSISDILASFPPPGVATPTGFRTTVWPGQYHSRANPDVTFPSGCEKRRPEKEPRRCCGLPRRVFILVILLLTIIIAAAVLIPVFLIVLPRKNEAASATQSTIDPDSCEAIQPCKNGGVSIGTKGSCGCVCVDGFRGSDCSIAGDGSCTTLDIVDETNEYHNATIGSAIPRLIKVSQSDFNIPLDASRLVKFFNSEEVSCTSGNALVTLNGANRKRSVPGALSLLDRFHKHPGHRHPKLGARGRPLEDVDSTVPTATTSSIPTSSATATSTPSSTSTISSRTLDFGRIAVLYIFEHTGDFRNATAAQESIQKFFDGAETISTSNDDDDDDTGVVRDELAEYLANPVGISYGRLQFSLDFVYFTIELGNGTVVGGSGR
ncbi:hypothetical protein VTO42DRAFT_1618 [Malbranchea cinnamomea]